MKTLRYQNNNILSACIPSAEKAFFFGIARKSEAGRMIVKRAQMRLNGATRFDVDAGSLWSVLQSIFENAQGNIAEDCAKNAAFTLTASEVRSLVAFAVRRGALNFAAARRLNDTDRKTFAGWALLYYSARVADHALARGLYETEARQIAERRAHRDAYAHDNRRNAFLNMAI